MGNGSIQGGKQLGFHPYTKHMPTPYLFVPFAPTLGAYCRLIVGLGNPGPRYDKTRHNVGFMVIDSIARGAGIDMRKLEKSAAVGRGHLHGRKVVLAKPMTFMNNSGESVAALAKFYKVGRCLLCLLWCCGGVWCRDGRCCWAGSVAWGHTMCPAMPCHACKTCVTAI